MRMKFGEMPTMKAEVQVEENEFIVENNYEQKELVELEKGRLENFLDKIKPQTPKGIKKAKALIEAFFAGRTPEELLEYEIEDHTKLVDEQREEDMQNGVPVKSEKMHELSKELHNISSEDKSSDREEGDNPKREALLKEMHDLAMTGENMQDVLELRNLYAVDSATSNRWQDIAPKSKQNPEFLKLDALLDAMINRPIPEGELTSEQKDRISEHINEINAIRWSKNKGISLEKMAAITKNMTEGALATDRIYNLLYARNNRAHWEKFIDSDYREGDTVLEDNELSPEYQEVDGRFRARLDEIPYASEVYFREQGTDWEVFEQLVAAQGIE